MIGCLHSIETMGLVDGPGTRTIFFLQGCPLRCAYCHNPDATHIVGGEEITPQRVLEISRRYRPYHGEEGGVTFSGGEALLQGEFLYESLKLLKEDGFNTCIDTAGIGQAKFYPGIFPLVDTILLDVKAFNNESFKDLTTGDFDVYLDFIKNLELNGFTGQIWARHVVVPNFTDDEDSIKEFIEILKPINHLVERIEILPYHTSGVKKYKELAIPYRLEGVEPMDKERSKELEIYANKLFADDLHQDRNERLKRKQEKIKELKERELVSEKEKADIIHGLRELPLLVDIDDEDIDQVLDEIVLSNVKAGEYIFKTGDLPDFMYLIYEGQMKIYFNSIDGEEQIFYVYRDGDFVGGLNLLEESSYRYMGRALIDCKVVAIPNKTFKKYFYDSPAVLRSVLSKSFERIGWAEDLIQRLSTSNASMKTAGLLLKLKNRIGVETKDGIKLELSLNREELGNYSGLRRETITRKLGEFKELGYIELVGNKTIIIKDLRALENYVI